MKVLGLQVYFKLPDDFKGTGKDAIAEMLCYHQEKENDLNSLPASDKDIGMIPLFDEFMKELDKGYKLIGRISLGEQLEDGSWKDI